MREGLFLSFCMLQGRLSCYRSVTKVSTTIAVIHLIS